MKTKFRLTVLPESNRSRHRLPVFSSYGVEIQPAITEAAALSFELAMAATTEAGVISWASEVAKLERESSNKLWPFTACTKGCAHCCHIPVGASPVEVTLLHREASASPRYVERVAQVARQVRANGGRRVACPLLHDGECSVYEKRPAACRGENSLSAASCAVDGGRHAYFGVLFQLTEQTLLAAHWAFKRRGLDVSPVDLRLALDRIAALPPDVPLARWLAGDHLFDGCRR